MHNREHCTCGTCQKIYVYVQKKKKYNNQKNQRYEQLQRASGATAPEHYIIDPLVALGLKPDSSKNYQQINEQKKRNRTKGRRFSTILEINFQYGGQCGMRSFQKVGIFEHFLLESLGFFF